MQFVVFELIAHAPQSYSFDVLAFWRRQGHFPAENSPEF
jgi:hypothetical protein